MQKTACTAGRVGVAATAAGVLLGELKEVTLEHGGGGGFAGGGPEFPQRRAVVPGEQGGIPGEPDGEEVAQGIIRMIVHGLLPHPILDVTRPAANGEELLVEVVGGVALEPELRDEPGDGLAAVGGERAHPAPETREAVDLGVGVEEGVFAPGLEEREMPPGHAPGGLARIVVGGAEVADRLDDVRGPGGAVLPVDGIGHGGQGVGRGWRMGKGGAERGGRPLRDEGGLCGGQGFSREGEGGGEVGIGQISRSELLRIVRGGHLHAAGEEAGHELAGIGKGPVGEAEEGIHRDEVLERPERGNARAGGAGSVEEVGGFARAGVGFG
jgi:hypothetical protein